MALSLDTLCASLALNVVCGTTDKDYDGVYAGDLLSRCMSHVKADNLWITIMPNANVIAVASLTEASAVLLAENVTLLPDALSAAEENGITVLSSEKSVFELCSEIGALIASAS